MCARIENVGATLGLGTLGAWAGAIMGFEKEERDWNWVETKCIGLRARMDGTGFEPATSARLDEQSGFNFCFSN
jgi:hypothetical protein